MPVTFEPKGDVAEWQLVYDHLQTLSIGDVVTYEDLSSILGRDFLVSRGPFHKANRRLLDTKKRGLVNVKNVGYRVVTAAEHEHEARSQHKQARRRLRRSRQWIENADRSQLSPEVAARFDRLEETLGRHEDFINRLTSRTARVEKALEKSRAEQEQHAANTQDKLDRLMAALERHGINIE